MNARLGLSAWGLIGLSILACTEDVVSPPPDPTGTAYVIDQQIFGSPEAHSGVWGLIETGATCGEITCVSPPGGLVAWGLENDRDLMTRMRVGWTRIWQVDDFTVTGVRESPFAATEQVIAGGYEGALTVNSAAILATYAGPGLVDSLSLRPGVPSAWFNAIASRPIKGSSTELIAVGAVTLSGHRTPYVALIDMQFDGALTFKRDQIFSELRGSSFWEIVAGVDGAFYLAGPREGTTDAFIWELSDSLTVRPVASLGRNTGVEALVPSQDGLIAAGSTEAKVDTLPDSGYIGAFLYDGSLVWEQRVAYADGDVGYLGCAIEDNLVFVAGYAGYFFVPATRRKYGQGLLTVVDVTNGQNVAEATFGQGEVSSGIHAIVISDGRAYMSGWTNEAIDPGGYQGWFLTVDSALMLSNSRQSAPDLLQRSIVRPSTDKTVFARSAMLEQRGFADR